MATLYSPHTYGNAISCSTLVPVAGEPRGDGKYPYCLQKLLRVVLKLPLTLFQLVRTHSDFAPWADWSLDNISVFSNQPQTGTL